MTKNKITTISDRFQTSIPAFLQRFANLKSGTKLHWEPISKNEFRVRVVGLNIPGPLAMLGKGALPEDNRSTEEYMKEIREGEQE